MSGRDARKILEDHGFTLVRQRGSHMVMQKTIPGSTITAIVPDHSQMRIGTLQSVIRQSQLARELFESE